MLREKQDQANMGWFNVWTNIVNTRQSRINKQNVRQIS